MSSSLRRRIFRHYGAKCVSCHLCGLPIPEWLVNRKHPLARTADHVVPKSLGGLNRAYNRRPAHACCNHYRGVRPLSPVLTLECRRLAVVEFSRIAFPAGRRWRTVRRLLKRFAQNSPDQSTIADV